MLATRPILDTGDEVEVEKTERRLDKLIYLLLWEVRISIESLANLLNNSWGLYKTVNNTKLLKYTAGKDGAAGSFQFQKNGKDVLSKTYTNLTSFNSTYSIQFSIRYIFN